MHASWPARSLAAWASIAVLAGCSAGLQPSPVDESSPGRWLPSIRDGATTRYEIIALWGLPASEYEEGRIAAYRLLLLDSDSELTEGEYERRLAEIALLPASPTGGIAGDLERLSASHVFVAIRSDNRDFYLKRLITRPREYGLILVYEPTGVVRRHALVHVYP